MKRVSLRLPDELHSQALAIVQSRRAAYGRISAKYSLNDFLLEAIEVAVAAQRSKKGKKEQGG